MKSAALAKALDHLDLAKEALNGLNIELGYRAYERAWLQFIAQITRCYSKIEQGSKGCNLSTPWYGEKKHERKMDALLSYLHHARNSEEHGLDYITQRQADAVAMHFPPNNEVKVGFEMMIDDKGNTHYRNPVVQSPNGGIEHVEIFNPRVHLVPVRDRGVTYDIPKTHAEQNITDASPTSIAEMAVRYIDTMLQEASELPLH